jgi:hypothetical protein
MLIYQMVRYKNDIKSFAAQNAEQAPNGPFRKTLEKPGHRTTSGRHVTACHSMSINQAQPSYQDLPGLSFIQKFSELFAELEIATVISAMSTSLDLSRSRRVNR